MKPVKQRPLQVDNFKERRGPLTELADPSGLGHYLVRIAPLLEILSVVSSVLLVVWGVAPLLPQIRWVMLPPVILALALVVYSFYVRGEKLGELGLSRQYFSQALKLLVIPTGLACFAFLLFGYLTHSFHRSTHFELNLLIVPLWGVAQQIVLQGFIYRRIYQLLCTGQVNCQAQKRQSNWAIFITAGLFGIVHLPNPALTVLTVLATLMWSWVYERAPNFWALGLSHGILSLVLMHSCPPWLLQSMSVGYKHFLYQKF